MNKVLDYIKREVRGEPQYPDEPVGELVLRVLKDYRSSLEQAKLLCERDGISGDLYVEILKGLGIKN